MLRRPLDRPSVPTTPRKTFRRRAAAALLCVAGIGLTGCPNELDEFRSAAAPQLEAGVNALLDGIVEGIFALVEPNETDGGTATP